MGEFLMPVLGYVETTGAMNWALRLLPMAFVLLSAALLVGGLGVVVALVARARRSNSVGR